MSIRRIAVLLAVLTVSVSSHAGPHQFGCPHSAARELTTFAHSMHTGSRFDSVAATPGWAVLTVGVEETPGLRDDNSLDLVNTNTTHLAVYRTGTQSKQTYWMHEYNDGALVHSHGSQPDEGVADLDDIRDAAQTKRFVLADVATMNVRADDMTWTNTIFTSSTEGPRASDLSRFTAINDKFLSALSARQADAIGSKVLFITTAVVGNEEILTLFTRTAGGKWIGFARSVTHYKAGTIAELQWHLRRIGKDGRLYVYGDDLPSIDFNALGDTAGVDTVRRTADIEKNLAETHRRLNRLADHSLRKETTTFINGIPESAAELAKAGLPAGGVDEWRAFRDSVETTMAGRYARRVAGRAEFVRELTRGTSDMIVIVAHSDGPAIYIGGDRVTLEELQRLPKRNSAGTRARVALLLSCDTGKLTKQQAGFFRSKLDSLATILVAKNFVDQVVAPDHTIKPAETIAVLHDLLDGKTASQLRVAYPGWQKVAVLRRRDGLA